MKKLIILLVTVSIWVTATGQSVSQGQMIPQGVVVYSLPRTCVRIVAEAQYTIFNPGPYAKYARKYLGIDAGQLKTITYELSRIEMTPILKQTHMRYIWRTSHKEKLNRGFCN